MKHAIAGALIVFAALSAPALAEDSPAVDQPEVEFIYPPAPCKNCALPKDYDSVEVVRSVREIDRSRTIHTTSVVPAARPVPPPRLVPVIPVTVVHFVTHQYRVIEAPIASFVEAPYAPRRARGCHRNGRIGWCAPAYLRVRG